MNDIFDLDNIFTDLYQIEKVASLPTPSDPAYPVGTIILCLADDMLYRNERGTWRAV